MPKDPNFFGINLMEKAEKYTYFTENIDRKEQQDGGNVEVGQMHCRQKKKSLWLGEIREGKSKQYQRNPIYQAI